MQCQKKAPNNVQVEKMTSKRKKMYVKKDKTTAVV